MDSAKLMENLIRRIRERQMSKRNRLLPRAIIKTQKGEIDDGSRSRSSTVKTSNDENPKAVVSSVCTIS